MVFSEKSSLKNKNLTVDVAYPLSIAVTGKESEKREIQQREDLGRAIKEHFTKQRRNCGLWVKAGWDTERLVSYLNEITGIQNCTMTIIDPFVSKDSLDYLLTLENIQLKLELVSCWKNKDPDDSGKKQKVEETISHTIKAIRNFQDYQIPVANLRWYNYSRKDSFHDRFIHIRDTTEPNDKNDKIYLLSNSLNNMLKIYDFCIVPLEIDAKIGAQDYIKKLLSSTKIDEYRIFPERDKK